MTKAGGTYTLREPDGTVTHFLANGKIDYFQDTNGNRITAAYTSGRLSGLTHSGGQLLTIAYNGAGLISSISDSTGRQALFTYDVASQHLVSFQGYDGLIVKYTYDATAGSVTEHALMSVEYPDGTHTFFAYDAAGRLSSVYGDSNAVHTDFTYESAGKVSVFDGKGTGALFFDDQGHLAKIEDSLGRPIHFAYDRTLKLTRATDGEGGMVATTYDKKGNPLTVTDLLGNVTRFAYNELNRLTSVTDPRGNAIHYNYDATGNLNRIAYADTTSAQIIYGSSGLPQSYTDRSGQTVNYLYNPAGQITKETFSDGSHFDFGYDGHGNLTSTVDPSGTTTYEYDAADRLTKVTYPSGRYLKYVYDMAGRRTQMKDQSGFETNYHYDSVGRLDRVYDAANATIVNYSYDAQSRLSRKVQGNGTYTTYEYDAAGQLLHLVNFAPNASVNSRFDFTYDALGQRITEGTLDGNWTYKYDANGQLTRAVFISTNVAIPNQDLAYVYDAVGNRIETSQNGVTTSYVTNGLNEYLSVGEATYAYDRNGNLFSKSDATGTTTYGYDFLNHLIRVVSPTGSWSYEYDALGNRIATVHNGQRTEYVLDPIGFVNVVGEYDGGAAPIARYTYGRGLVGRIDANGTRNYYDFDALGSTAGLTNSLGGVINQYAYVPFGEALFTKEAIDNPFEYAGRYGVMIESNGLHFMRARFYQSGLGRFVSPDPVGLRAGDVNLYRYVANSPLDALDPTGLKPGGVETPPPVPVQDPYSELIYGPTQPWYIAHPELLDTGIEVAGLFLDVLKSDFWPLIVLDKVIDFYQLYQELDEHYQDFYGNGDNQGNNADGQPSTPRNFTPVRTPVPPPYVPTPPKGPPGVPIMPPGSPAPVPTAVDPNQKAGILGFGASGFVAQDGLLSYRIDFENDTGASAPAQQVDIRDQLVASLDWSTFELLEVAFGDNIISIPSHSQYFQTTLPGMYNGRTFDVQIEVGLNSDTGQVFARFLSIDPSTQLPPDVLAGFLPPEDGTGRGQGHFTYVIRPKAGLPTGTEIRNIALITFDVGETIATNQIDPHDPSKGTDPAKEALNTIDAGAPTSSVSALPATSYPSFTVNWNGVDDAGGSGIGSYDILVSIDGGPFAVWLNDRSNVTAQYVGQVGHTYAFYSVATDNVGHVEGVPSTADATTLTVPPPDLTPPHVAGIPVQKGLTQRSYLDWLAIDFSEQINAAALISGSTITDAVKLVNLGINAPADADQIVPLAAGQFQYQHDALAGISRLIWSLDAFTGAKTSLADGFYQLTLDASLLTDAAGNSLDGDRNGTAGGDYVVAFHRLEGDADGDMSVLDADMNLVNAAIGATANAAAWDVNADLDRDRRITVRDRLIVARASGHAILPPATLWGDFNVDGKVDAADHALWTANFGRASGATLTSGDADGDRDVDGSDFLAWQRNVGAPAAAVALASLSATAVEPIRSGPAQRASFGPPPILAVNSEPQLPILAGVLPSVRSTPSQESERTGIRDARFREISLRESSDRLRYDQQRPAVLRRHFFPETALLPLENPRWTATRLHLDSLAEWLASSRRDAREFGKESAVIDEVFADLESLRL